MAQEPEFVMGGIDSLPGAGGGGCDMWDRPHPSPPDPHTAALLAIAAALRNGLRDVAAAIREYGRAMGEGGR